ncbi:hypothetical protein GF407_03500 [candidate division KSB1 bacterium]|nr:hypothetical protein [candidate division KSB1 bacterium]
MRYFLFCLILTTLSFSQIIIDHNCTDITQIPQSAIENARASLHIGYGHTSHGSQLITGMQGLIAFANNGGKGLDLPDDIFAFNNGGSGGALDLEEGDGYGSGWLDHDCGYYPNWIQETRIYLDDPSHSDVNVIIWSWCGQASGYSEQQMIDRYLDPMAQLELDYPDVTFVYMTGHADGTGVSGTLHQRNQQIRNFCRENNKVLYDFYDIECYDPDGTYFGDQYVDDDCSYSGGNWAIEWQNSHTEGVDWYSCGSAHSQPLNANQKAYAAWWLWARLGGWNGPPADGVQLQVNAFLQGPYDANGDSMRTDLMNQDLLPCDSPFGEDPDALSAFPADSADIVDWVLVQLRQSDGQTVVDNKSAFLRRDGSICDSNGADTLVFSGIVDGDYHIVVKSRNHLDIMSRQTAALSCSTLFVYDFYSAAEQSYGPKSQIELKAGIYGAIAGDCNGDGHLTSRDYVVWYIGQQSGPGYAHADVSLDGDVAEEDAQLWRIGAEAGWKCNVP